MNRIKSLVVTAVLVCSLSIGVRAGDIGTPGYVPPTGPATGDIGTPGCEYPEVNSTQETLATSDPYEDSYSSDYMLYLFWTALTLF